MRRAPSSGFTLIEGLIVAALLGFLLLAATIGLFGSRDPAVAEYMQALYPGVPYKVYCRSLGLTRRCDVQMTGRSLALSCRAVLGCVEARGVLQGP